MSTHVRRAARIGLVVAVFTTLGAVPAVAVDGTKLIDHARAMAGGTTPGDTPGYPVTISQPGSYVLSSNLVQPNPNTDVIVITASDVTLNLNGFSILGATVCTGDPSPSCTGGGPATSVSLPGRGIVTADNTINVTVRNGTVHGMGNVGILLHGGGHLVEYVHARSNAFGGILILAGDDRTPSIAQHNRAARNATGNAFAGTFQGAGIMVQRGMARNNTADSTGFGIRVQVGSASHNVVTHNFTGLVFGAVGESSFFGNVMLDNTNHFAPGGTLNLGQNQCGAAACLNSQF